MVSKVLLFDLETTPLISYTWGTWETDVIKVKQDWFILCFSYKWLGEKTVRTVALPDFEGYKKDKTNDKKLVEKLWELFDKADMIIAHNGNSFDIKKSQARFVQLGLKPPSPFHKVDTKLVAKRYFNFTSNKLDDLGKYFKIGQKLETGGFETWLGCMAGDKKSWKNMIKYNKQDVILLEKVYIKLRPYIINHPRLNLDLAKCANCGGVLLSRGSAITKRGRYHRYQCGKCGSWSQGGKVKKT